MMSLSAISLGDMFCMSRKDGTGGGGWVYQKAEESITLSGLCVCELLLLFAPDRCVCLWQS